MQRSRARERFVSIGVVQQRFHKRADAERRRPVGTVHESTRLVENNPYLADIANLRDAGERRIHAYAPAKMILFRIIVGWTLLCAAPEPVASVVKL
jgi:hypothetical protein